MFLPKINHIDVLVEKISSIQPLLKSIFELMKRRHGKSGSEYFS